MGRIVIVGYRPKPGKADELREMLATHAAGLYEEALATSRDNVLMEAADGTIIEVFEWVSSEALAAAHKNPAVLAMWEAFSEVCDYVPVGELPECGQLFSEFEALN